MSAEGTFPKRIASLDQVFSFLDGFYDAEAIGDRTRFALSLVAEELFTNLVKYNTSGHNPVTVRVGREHDVVRMELIDRDVDAFDPGSAPQPKLDAPIDQRQPGGLGLHLVRAVVDRIAFDYEDRVMTIAVTKKLEPSDV